MFKLYESAEFVWPVKCKRPNPDAPGKHITETFDCTFAEMSQADTEAYITNIETQDITAFLKLAIIDFDGLVVNADNEEVTDPEERVDILCSKAALIEPLFEAYGHGLLGRKGKN